jgi:hypothetical protein
MLGFFAIQKTWALSSKESHTDVKELIPEFFFLPEFLCNLNHCNFGERQCGDIVDNVALPVSFQIFLPKVTT